MLACFIRRRIVTSLSRLDRSLVFSLERLISLMAASCPVSRCRPRHTMAKEPEPTWEPTSQSPTRRGPAISMHSASLMSMYGVCGACRGCAGDRSRNPAGIGSQSVSRGLRLSNRKSGEGSVAEHCNRI